MRIDRLIGMPEIVRISFRETSSKRNDVKSQNGSREVRPVADAKISLIFGRFSALNEYMPNLTSEMFRN